MDPSNGHELLRDLAKRAKQARQEGKAPDNEAALRAHKERNAGCSTFLAAMFVVIFVVIALLFIVSLFS